MASYVFAGKLCFLTLCFIKPTVTGAFRVAQRPDFKFNWYYRGDVGAATDVQACLDAAYAANPDLWAISFDNATGECYQLSDPDGIWRRPSGEQPREWVRIDQHMQMSAVTSCLTEQDATYLMLQMIFVDRTCHSTGDSFDSATRLCTGDRHGSIKPRFDFGGFLKNGTAYRLSGPLAAEAVSYTCDDELATKMIFGGTWYCYYSYNLSSSEQAQGASIITGDYCSQVFGGTAHVLKISEPREYNYLYGHFGNVHLGATLLSGTTYQWYDGTVADDLPWESGYPRGRSKTLVQIADVSADSYVGYNVVDTAAPITRLICKKPATNSAYDACSKFKTCA